MYSAGELLPQPAGDPGPDAQEEEARAHGRVHHRPGHHRHHVLTLHPPHAEKGLLIKFQPPYFTFPPIPDFTHSFRFAPPVFQIRRAFPKSYTVL